MCTLYLFDLFCKSMYLNTTHLLNSSCYLLWQPPIFSLYESVLLFICFNFEYTHISEIIQYLSFSITSWEIDGETMETVSDFIFLGSKITTDGDCSHEIKRRLLLGRKVMTNLDSIFKSRDITLPTKVCLVKAMVFPVVTYGCESWTVKKAEHRRIDAFELWYGEDS